MLLRCGSGGAGCESSVVFAASVLMLLLSGGAAAQTVGTTNGTTDAGRGTPSSTDDASRAISIVALAFATASSCCGFVWAVLRTRAYFRANNDSRCAPEIAAVWSATHVGVVLRSPATARWRVSLRARLKIGVRHPLYIPHEDGCESLRIVMQTWADAFDLPLIFRGRDNPFVVDPGAEMVLWALYREDHPHLKREEFDLLAVVCLLALGSRYTTCKLDYERPRIKGKTSSKFTLTDIKPLPDDIVGTVLTSWRLRESLTYFIEKSPSWQRGHDPTSRPRYAELVGKYLHPKMPTMKLKLLAEVKGDGQRHAKADEGDANARFKALLHSSLPDLVADIRGRKGTSQTKSEIVRRLVAENDDSDSGVLLGC